MYWDLFIGRCCLLYGVNTKWRSRFHCGTVPSYKCGKRLALIFKDAGICKVMMRSTCMASFICQIIQRKVTSRMANAERVSKIVPSFVNHIYIRGWMLWYSAYDMIYVIYAIKLNNLKFLKYRKKGFNSLNCISQRLSGFQILTRVPYVDVRDGGLGYLYQISEYSV